jgi:hypothetical protein
MANYTVEIGDEKGNSFKISVSTITTFGKFSTGSWRTIDKGYIRYNSGTVGKKISNGEFCVEHLLLCTNDNTYGIQLNDFENIWGANDEGTGFIKQSWVLSFEPGRISWALV